jgi:hypothetical protein
MCYLCDQLAKCGASRAPYATNQMVIQDFFWLVLVMDALIVSPIVSGFLMMISRGGPCALGLD